MRYIATTGFGQGNNNVLNTPDGAAHIERGTEIELPFYLPITKLPKDEYLKYSIFFGQQPMLVPLDSPEGRKILSDKKTAEKVERKKRAWSLEKWCLIIGVILAALTLIWGVFVWLKPGR